MRTPNENWSRDEMMSASRGHLCYNSKRHSPITDDLAPLVTAEVVSQRTGGTVTMTNHSNFPDSIQPNSVEIPRSDNTAGFVYLIQPIGHNVYKIGCSVDPAQRIYKFELRSKGLKFKVVAAIFYTQNYMKAEWDWQRQYEQYKLSGEWFALPDSEVEYFKSRAVQS